MLCRVVETVVAAHRYQGYTRSDLHTYGEESSDEDAAPAPLGSSNKSSSPVSVVVDIAWMPNWVVEMNVSLECRPAALSWSLLTDT